MATITGTSVLFYKVATMTQFNDLTKINGAIYFVESEKKLYLDGVWYGFSDTDGGQFLKLTGGTMTGGIIVPSIEGVDRVAFSSDSAIVRGTTDGGGGFSFQMGGHTNPVPMRMKADGSIVFGSSNISGIPEPVVSSSPISKGYLENKLSGLIGNTNGVATLDSGGKVPSSQLPSYVDDVLEFANQGAFPQPGEAGKIYVALDNNKTYRWSSSAYVEISASLALGETSGTAYRGDRGKLAYDHTLLTNNPHGVTKSQVGLGSVENYGKATKAEAEVGTSDAKYMTPLRTKEAIDKLTSKLSWTVVS